MSSLIIEHVTLQNAYDHKSCWVHARCGIIPRLIERGEDICVMTMQKLHMGDSEFVSDIFSGISSQYSLDGGRTWTDPLPQEGLASRTDDQGIEHVICDFSPQYHKASRQLLGIGITTYYQDRVAASLPGPQQSVYSTYCVETGAWSESRVIPMPADAHFFAGGTGCIQWVELGNGDLLVPVYCRSEAEGPYSVSVLRYAFDGKQMGLLEAGPAMTLPVQRGFVEPSLICCQGKFWLTLRNDEGAYFCTSANGLHFDYPRRWTFDDGRVLGSENTQQHWAQLAGRLYLVYTRKGLGNDHVFRHRAPLLIGEVDQKRGCIIRESEEIIVPERGAGLGNFGVSQNENGEAWICVSEWMENTGRWNAFHWSALERKFPSVDLDELALSPGRSALCELSGSNNSIHLVKLKSNSHDNPTASELLPDHVVEPASLR